MLSSRTAQACQAPALTALNLQAGRNLLRYHGQLPAPSESGPSASPTARSPFLRFAPKPWLVLSALMPGGLCTQAAEPNRPTPRSGTATCAISPTFQDICARKANDLSHPRTQVRVRARVRARARARVERRYAIISTSYAASALS